MTQEGERELAILDLDKAIELDPTDALALDYRGSSYSDKGEYEQAIRDFDAAIRLDPTLTRVYTDRGIAHARMKKWDEAISDYSAAHPYRSAATRSLCAIAALPMKKRANWIGPSRISTPRSRSTRTMPRPMQAEALPMIRWESSIGRSPI